MLPRGESAGNDERATDKADLVFARKLQEVLGGQWGEITVSLQYRFQGWNCRAPQKYRDMLLDIGTDEIAHVEMLATMIAHLLEGAPVAVQDEAVKDPAVLVGFDETPVPNSFPQGLELEKVAYQFWNCSSGSPAGPRPPPTGSLPASSP
jgi:hypothetical protein